MPNRSDCQPPPDPIARRIAELTVRHGLGTLADGIDDAIRRIALRALAFGDSEPLRMIDERVAPREEGQR